MVGTLDCASLREVRLSLGSHLKVIYGFCGSASSCRIEILPFVEVLEQFGFLGSLSLVKVIFHQRDI
jgi:hypothetical protein